KREGQRDLRACSLVAAGWASAPLLAHPRSESRASERPLPPAGGRSKRMKLKDVYPLYLNNKAAQPNTDLVVTDKYTGEVAFRTALATPDVIDQAIAGAVRAAEPMARLASFEKRDVLTHCVARFQERFDELA